MRTCRATRAADVTDYLTLRDVPQQPSEPIKAQNKEKFEWVKERIIAELEGEVTDSMRITRLDSITIR